MTSTQYVVPGVSAVSEHEVVVVVQVARCVPPMESSKARAV